MISRLLQVGGLLLFTASPVTADEAISYQGLWDAVARDPDCKTAQFPDFVLATCEQQRALWYFTKSNHPAHPGVIKRFIVQENDGVYVHEQGYSFASDAAQPAFKAWLAQIQALDRQAAEDLEKRPRTPKAN